MKIAFIGLGVMGRPMARNLINAGHELVIVSRHDDVRTEFEQLGAASAKTPRDAAAAADLIITMLPNSPDVEEVALGANGLVNAARDGLTLIDCSSIDPLVARDVAERLATQGMVMLDAPVSGGEPGAINGTLSIMVGGPQEQFDTYKPVLDAMGTSVVRVGEVGAGNITKLANQSIVAVNIAVVAEALVLAEKAGVDPAGVVEAIKGGLAGSNAMNAKAPMMLEHRFDPGFRVGLHLKDLTNVMATSHTVASPMPLTAVAFELMTQLKASGHDREDHSALLRVYELLANAQLGAGSTD